MTFSKGQSTPQRDEAPLFFSYHGMIKAMTYEGNLDASGASVYFELALTNDTEKVSSCFPCATFMTANGLPPSSTHLGKGDNWGIPGRGSSSSDLVSKWECKIRSWYASGEAHLSPDLSKSIRSIGNLSEDDFKNALPDIFLESLTFEKSFTDRIKRTLRPPVPPPPSDRRS